MMNTHIVPLQSRCTECGRVDCCCIFTASEGRYTVSSGVSVGSIRVEFSGGLSAQEFEGSSAELVGATNSALSRARAHLTQITAVQMQHALEQTMSSRSQPLDKPGIDDLQRLLFACEKLHSLCESFEEVKDSSRFECGGVVCEIDAEGAFTALSPHMQNTHIESAQISHAMNEASKQWEKVRVQYVDTAESILNDAIIPRPATTSP